MMSWFTVFLVVTFPLCSLSNAVIILRHNGVIKLFKERMDSANLIKKDPLDDYNLQQRQDFCDQLIAAKQFEMLATDVEIPQPSENTTTLENIQRRLGSGNKVLQTFLKHDTQRLKTQKFGLQINVKAFLCAYDFDNKLGGKQWFVAYDFQRIDRFLIEKTSKTSLWVKALISVSATCRSFSHIVQLAKYFLPQIHPGNGNRLYIPSHMKLCFLTRFEHFRLCSSTFDALSSRGYFQSDIRTLNYVILHSHLRCQDKIIRLPSDDQLNVEVLPCSINVKYSEPQFYVLPDLKEEASVFILTRNDIKKDEVEFTKEKIVNIDVLIGMDYARPIAHKITANKRKRNEIEGTTAVKSDADGDILESSFSKSNEVNGVSAVKSDADRDVLENSSCKSNEVNGVPKVKSNTDFNILESSFVKRNEVDEVPAVKSDAVKSNADLNILESSFIKMNEVDEVPQ